MEARKNAAHDALGTFDAVVLGKAGLLEVKCSTAFSLSNRFRTGAAARLLYVVQSNFRYILPGDRAYLAWSACRYTVHAEGSSKLSGGFGTYVRRRTGVKPQQWRLLIPVYRSRVRSRRGRREVTYNPTKINGREMSTPSNSARASGESTYTAH
ncbi:hypothetical protein LshimejAT787_1300870 [Lyophyllum shimeji]|uniref:Uncharacterized protein n=1 Tax=Lyophyllum shimeji TaxID=47721 RepID=A0A9P3PXX1_LYOSH|nr:hypothetical protein LshimejAT787_1300870 [Lyophyllum shimeji]